LVAQDVANRHAVVMHAAGTHVSLRIVPGRLWGRFTSRQRLANPYANAAGLDRLAVVLSPVTS